MLRHTFQDEVTTMLHPVASPAFPLATFSNLTPTELRNSNHPDEKLDAIFIQGTNPDTDYSYSFGLIAHHPHGPYVKIDTEKRAEFLAKGSEREAEEALKKTAFAVRARTGGFFEIHPFYGAIWGTHFNPIKDFCKGGPDEDLTTIIYLTDNGRKFDAEFTREAQSIGNVIRIPGPNAQRFLKYMNDVNKGNPNQRNRDQAITNGLGAAWDKEFARYNPEPGLGARIAKLFGKGQTIPPAMRITQESSARFMDDLQEMGLTDVRATQTNYAGLTLTELAESTFPVKEKLTRLFDEQYNALPIVHVKLLY